MCELVKDEAICGLGRRCLSSFGSNFKVLLAAKGDGALDVSWEGALRDSL
jgi:hypothetical protein